MYMEDKDLCPSPAVTDTFYKLKLWPVAVLLVQFLTLDSPTFFGGYPPIRQANLMKKIGFQNKNYKKRLFIQISTTAYHFNRHKIVFHIQLFLTCFLKITMATMLPNNIFSKNKILIWTSPRSKVIIETNAGEII